MRSTSDHIASVRFLRIRCKTDRGAMGLSRGTVLTINPVIAARDCAASSARFNAATCQLSGTVVLTASRASYLYLGARYCTTASSPWIPAMPGQSPQILLIEGDRTLLEITAFRLELLGYGVDYVRNGRAGARMAPRPTANFGDR